MGQEALTADQILKVEIGTCQPIIYDIGPRGEVLSKKVLTLVS